jgi:hypothetical protein
VQRDRPHPRKTLPTDRTEETAVHHTVSYHLVHAHLADLRRQAQQATLARAARRARVGQRGRTAPRVPDLDRRGRRRPSPRTVLADQPGTAREELEQAPTSLVP